MSKNYKVENDLMEVWKYTENGRHAIHICLVFSFAKETKKEKEREMEWKESQSID